MGRPTGPDVPLGEIGWNIGSCDQTGSTLCTNPIADCGDVATCVACIAERAADDALVLFADRPVILPTADKVLSKCLRALGLSSAKSLVAVAKGFGRCWRNVSDRSSGGSCSCPNQKASSIAGKAKAANAVKICRVCGGADDECGGGDDYAPAALGFAADCSAIGTCGGPVQTVRDVANCADCVGHVLMDAAVRRRSARPERRGCSGQLDRREHQIGQHPPPQHHADASQPDDTDADPPPRRDHCEYRVHDAAC